MSPENQEPPLIHALQIGMDRFGNTAGGGLDRMFDGLMRHLPGVGVDVKGLISGAFDNSAHDGATRSVCAPTDPLPSRLLKFRSAFRRLAEESDTDIVAAHFSLYAVPILDLLEDTAFVMHFHGPWGMESGAEGESRFKVGAKTSLERWVYRQAQHFIVLSDAFRKVLVRQFNVNPNNISIVPGGVDVARFNVNTPQQSARHRLGLPIDRPIVVSVRRLARRMGLENLIDAWKGVHSRCPEALLLIAGKGPLSGDLQHRIDENGLHDHVRLLGFVSEDDLPFLYRSADLSVLPTETLEGFGLTTIESMAAGTPVLVTPVGGLPEVVQDLSEDVILPDSSVRGLSKGLTEAILKPEALPSSDACLKFVESKYAWSTVAKRTRSVYASLL